MPLVMCLGWVLTLYQHGVVMLVDKGKVCQQGSQGLASG